MEFDVDENPLQGFQLWKKDSTLGLPTNAIEFLAMVNPRPIGIILCTVGRLQEDCRLAELSPAGFQDEMKFNSGTYIQLLLRRYDICPDKDVFISMFTPCNKALLHLTGRWKWAARSVGLFSNSAKERIVEKVTLEFKSMLQTLEVDFVKWAVSYQKEIATIYDDTLASNDFLNGNAIEDFSKGGLRLELVE